MSGHSHWKQIQHKKGSADQRRGKLFSKLLQAISIAAKTDPNPQFNPRLRTAVEKAKENKVPQENIERAISKASEIKNLEDLVVEAYGPEGTAIIIEAITDNKNRTMTDIKIILNKNGAKLANPGSVLWAFDPPADGKGWQAKFPQTVSEDAKIKLQELLTSLEDQDDIQKVITNAT